MKSLTHDIHQLFLVVDQVIMLGAGSGDADYIHFLKSIVADQRGGYLTGENNDRDRVHVGRGYTGNSVGSPRAGSQQSDTHFPADSGVAVSGMDRRLFMTHQHVGEFRTLHQLVIKIDDRPSRVTENCVYIFLLEAFNYCLGTAYLRHGHVLWVNLLSQH